MDELIVDGALVGAANDNNDGVQDIILLDYDDGLEVGTNEGLEVGSDEGIALGSGKGISEGLPDMNNGCNE